MLPATTYRQLPPLEEEALDSKQEIQWPAHFSPELAPVFVSNELVVEARREAVWEWLVSATLWPTFYSNSSNVVLEGGKKQLGAGVRFTWRTFGVNLTTQVEEFVPEERIAWRAKGFGVDAYHAWLLSAPSEGRCRILTEETQHGVLARMGKLLMPGRMHRQHQLWLEALGAKAKLGRP